MKQLLQLFAIGLLTYCSSPEQGNTQQEQADSSMSDSAIVEHETKGLNELGDESRYLKQVQRINKVVAKIEKQDLISSKYIYYDENGEKWELDTYRDKETKLQEVSFSLGFESQEYTLYYLEGDQVCLISNTRIYLGGMRNEVLHTYYLDKESPFYEAIEQYHKGKLITDTGSVISEFNTEDHAFPIYTNRKELEGVISRSIPEELHVTQEDFKLTDNYQMTQGTPVPELTERTEEIEFIAYLDIPSVTTSFDKASNKSTLIVNDEGEVMYEADFEGKLHFCGLVDAHILLEISNGPLTYELAIIDQVAAKVTYRKPVKGQTYKNGKLLVMRELKNDEIDRISFNGDCSEFESQGKNYKRYGVFEVTVGTAEDKFTNQVFCISDL